MTNQKIPCDTVRDLLPSYIDKLTSETTNRLIEEHISDCVGCAEVLNHMRTPEAEPAEAVQRGKKEIDFLKKNKMPNLKIIIGSIAGALALVVVILALKAFVIGEANYSGMIASRVEVSGSDVTLTAVPVDSVHAVSGLTFEEEDGVITVRARTVVSSFLHRGDLRKDYSAGAKIRRIVFNGRIIWDDGAEISFLTAQIYETRHDHMGSISDNMRTANALGMSSYLGSFTSELKTSGKPYVWKITFDKPFPQSERAVWEKEMESLAYVMLGVIGNLDEVEYACTCDGESFTKSVSTEDATAFLGRDVKDCGESPRVLGELLSKTGLETYIMGMTESYLSDSRNVTLDLVNFTEDEIQAINFEIYSDGVLLSGGGICNADNSPIKKGEVFNIFFERGDFGGRDNLSIELGIERPDGKSYTVADSLRVPSDYGAISTRKLYGSRKKGFSIVQ